MHSFARALSQLRKHPVHRDGRQAGDCQRGPERIRLVRHQPIGLEGQIVANAAIVPAGTQGAIHVFAAGATELIVDINGYFVRDPF